LIRSRESKAPPDRKSYFPAGRSEERPLG
jgi:hypothetical protein